MCTALGCHRHDRENGRHVEPWTTAIYHTETQVPFVEQPMPQAKPATIATAIPARDDRYGHVHRSLREARTRVTCKLLAQKAFSGIESAAGRPRAPEDFRPYTDLIATDCMLTFGVPADTPLGTALHGRAAIIDFWTRLAPGLFGDVHLDEPLSFVCDTQRAVVLGRESYDIVLTGQRVEGKAFTAVLEFRDGLIVRDRRVYEMAEFIDAHRHHRSSEAAR
ncbi:nuclear transport factor 2 family protein [Jiangella ureilytica]|uniref:Nuclear transport factor 2 family protein n=1 Tax=Jiangella ureilytica TaxID=2530374 RepID=A0A4R4RYC6_9ACTN|nr:nuclear transport factor 2 family protein [Jiangella ureilytica]TDC53962.1 nuclear transport factor 2 family protein [Jiangella ureilytica]